MVDPCEPCETVEDCLRFLRMKAATCRLNDITTETIFRKALNFLSLALPDLRVYATSLRCWWRQLREQGLNATTSVKKIFARDIVQVSTESTCTEKRMDIPIVYVWTPTTYPGLCTLLTTARYVAHR